jgi:hypothetical protein
MLARRLQSNLRVAGAASANAEHSVMKVTAWLRMPSEAGFLSSRVIQRCTADTTAMLYIDHLC